MKRYDFKNVKWVFDIKGNPDLGRAILRRLKEMGCKVRNCEDLLDPPGGPYRWSNITVGWGGPGIAHVGACDAEDNGEGEIFHNYTRCVLRDLFDPYIEGLLPQASPNVLLRVQIGKAPSYTYVVSEDVAKHVQGVIARTIRSLHEEEQDTEWCIFK
jgi:hypothetical protein